MSYNVAPLSHLIEQFEQLPGIGRKTAQRLALFMLGRPEAEAKAFAQAVLDARESIHRCAVCCNLTDEDICSMCASDRRDRSIICVVEFPSDVIAIEKTREYNGLYHVLHGVISPMEGIGPEQLTIKALLSRIDSTVGEVILATNPTVEGDATAMYISRLLAPMGIICSRLAYGIPVGGDLEYADEVTLGRAISGRSRME